MTKRRELKQTNKPPALGDIELVRKGDETWRVDRGGATVASGVDFATVTALIRGELALDELAKDAQ